MAKSISTPHIDDPKKLYRSGNNKILAGICGGIGEYLNVDPVVIRVIWVLLALLKGAGLMLYILAWIIMPRNPEHEWE